MTDECGIILGVQTDSTAVALRGQVRVQRRPVGHADRPRALGALVRRSAGLCGRLAPANRCTPLLFRAKAIFIVEITAPITTQNA